MRQMAAAVVAAARSVSTSGCSRQPASRSPRLASSIDLQRSRATQGTPVALPSLQDGARAAQAAAWLTDQAPKLQTLIDLATLLDTKGTGSASYTGSGSFSDAEDRLGHELGKQLNDLDIDDAGRPGALSEARRHDGDLQGQPVGHHGHPGRARHRRRPRADREARRCRGCSLVEQDSARSLGPIVSHAHLGPTPTARRGDRAGRFRARRDAPDGVPWSTRSAPATSTPTRCWRAAVRSDRGAPD